jgi:chitinase
MKRRLFLLSGTAAATAAALSACGGGGGGGGVGGPASSPANGSLATGVATSQALAADGLPAKILGCYYTAWDAGTYKITDVPTDFNVIYLFHCKPNGMGNNQGDGGVVFEHFGDITAEQVQACRKRGQKVILTVGGAGQGYAWDNREKSGKLVSSFRAIADQLGGVDGIDYNNFEGTIVHEGNVDTVGAEMVWAAKELKAAYGQQFAVTSPPQPNDPVQRRLMQILKDGGVLSYAGPQYYDWSGFNEPGYISNSIDVWTGLLGEDHVAIGLSANYSNGPSMDDCIREWNVVKAKHPTVRGMFCWSAQHNLQGGNAWGAQMRSMLG